MGRRQKGKLDKNTDPSPYHGPIERVDGTRPYNHYLWPLPDDQWWANGQLGNRIDSRWHFSVVALKDGRYSVEGSVYSIEDNDYAGDPVVFPTREKAIRISAARMIRAARWSRNWDWRYGGLNGEKLASVVNWAREIVAKETGKEKPKPRFFKEQQREPQKTGLPLFDFYPGGN